MEAPIDVKGGCQVLEWIAPWCRRELIQGRWRRRQSPMWWEEPMHPMWWEGLVFVVEWTQALVGGWKTPERPEG
jgi:hypothetical protein